MFYNLQMPKQGKDEQNFIQYTTAMEVSKICQ
jgi:hypothetical protein